MVTPSRNARITALALGLSMCLGASARAQPLTRLYAGGSVGSFSVDADAVEGRSPAAGLFGGFAFSRYVDAELEVAFPSDSFTRSYTGISVSFADPGASREEIERRGVTTRFDTQRDVSSSVSAVVVIHPPLERRVTPGLILGVTNQRVRDRTEYTPIAIPPGVDPQHPSVIGRVETWTRNLGGPTIGGNLAIRLTSRLYVVPDIRYDYGSIGDEINNALRTSVRMMWRF